MQMRNQRLFGSWRLRLPPRLWRIAVRAGVAVVIAVVGLVVTPATPAHASWYQCVKTEFCMWSDINDSGAFYAAVNSDANLTRWSISTAYCRQGTWNDCASSAYNYGTSGMGVFMYQDINYGGGDFCLPNYTGLDNFTVVTFNNSWVGLNDNVSSLRWSWSC